MPRESIVIGAKPEQPSYINGRVVKIHEEDIYDVRLPSGQVESYVENVSSITYNSGEYVVILVIGTNESRSCKIIGRGRKFSNSSSITEVIV